MRSPTQNSLKYLRKLGYTAAVVEKWNPHARITQDLFGIVDIIAFRPESVGVLAVQTTSQGGTPARVKKAREFETSFIRPWMKAGNRFEVHGWKKVKNRWELRVMPWI